MFALFEAGDQVVGLHHHPRLRRCAPHLGLTMFNLFEVVRYINQVTSYPYVGNQSYHLPVGAPASPLIRPEREERQAIVAPEVTDLEVTEAVAHGDGRLDIGTDDIDGLIAWVIARHPEMAGGSFVEDLVGTCNFEALDITVT